MNSSLFPMAKSLKTLILASQLSFHSFSHIKRSGNFVAHALARMAKGLVDMQIWIEEVPEDLYPLVLYDVQ